MRPSFWHWNPPGLRNHAWQTVTMHGKPPGKPCMANNPGNHAVLALVITKTTPAWPVKPCFWTQLASHTSRKTTSRPVIATLACRIWATASLRETQETIHRGTRVQTRKPPDLGVHPIAFAKSELAFWRVSPFTASLYAKVFWNFLRGRSRCNGCQADTGCDEE